MTDLDSFLPEGMQQAAPRAQIPWSNFQEDIFRHTANTQTNLAIEAVAGSGKTTTIVEATRRLPVGGDTLFLAFNKSIVNTLSSKLPFSIDCKTMNGLGHGLLTRKLRAITSGRPKLNSYRIWDVMRSVLTDEQAEEYGSAMVRFVSLARANALGIRTELTARVFEEALGDFEIDIPDEYEQLACRQAVVVMERLISTCGDEFDFDDQLYMPIYWEMAFPRYDTVFIDEAQDLSPIQHLMLERLSDRGARIIAVGDSRQAIYGFRGADTASMSNLAERFNMTILPLSISYRCPKAVVKEAQKIVYHIQSAETAPEGEVIYADEMPEPKDFPSHCMILCRTNAPMFNLALQFLKERVPCHVMSNFGKDIISFVKKMNAKTTEDLEKELKAWMEKEVAKAEAREWWGKANMIRDKYDALLPFCEAFDFKIQVVAALQQLLASSAGATLATIHKAKGLEAPTVYILRPDLLPAPFAKTERAIAQEMNLKYVAVTRAQKELIFLPEDV